MTPRPQPRKPGDGMASPADPSEDELAQHWSLTPADLAVIADVPRRGPSSPFRPATLHAARPWLLSR